MSISSFSPPSSVCLAAHKALSTTEPVLEASLKAYFQAISTSGRVIKDFTGIEPDYLALVAIPAISFIAAYAICPVFGNRSTNWLPLGLIGLVISPILVAIAHISAREIFQANCGLKISHFE